MAQDHSQPNPNSLPLISLKEHAWYPWEGGSQEVPLEVSELCLLTPGKASIATMGCFYLCCLEGISQMHVAAAVRKIDKTPVPLISPPVCLPPCLLPRFHLPLNLSSSYPRLCPPPLISYLSVLVQRWASHTTCSGLLQMAAGCVCCQKSFYNSTVVNL